MRGQSKSQIKRDPRKQTVDHITSAKKEIKNIPCCSDDLKVAEGTINEVNAKQRPDIKKI